MKIFFFALVALFVFSGCSGKYASTPVYDLEHYPQNTRYYAKNIHAKSSLLEVQKQYKEHYFTPWSMSEPPVSKQKAMWALTRYKFGTTYAENLQPIPERWFNEMAYQSNFEKYGTVNAYAISLHFCSLRAFPTHKPLFSDPTKAGEGFPFDYMQNSGIHSNEPLFISHYSTDGAWVYVFTSYASGWIRTREMALLRADEAAAYEQYSFLHVNREYIPLKQEDGTFITYARVGMFLPFIEETKSGYSVLVYVKNRGLQKVFLPRHSGVKKPLLLNQNNLTAITNELIGRNYGWGGLYEERDCSSTLRDIFASFGIWLPRNSSKQAKVGKVISLEHLSEHEKITSIKNRAIPFETILYRKGHVLLYLGMYEDEIMVFHDTWGIRTLDGNKEGRKIIGKTIISTLKLGSKLPNYDPSHSHLKNLISMNIVTQ